MALYSRWTENVTLGALIFVTNGIILLSLASFWIVLTYYDPGWSHYAFYLWSAIAGAVAIAQAWTFTSETFARQESGRVFGWVAAGGTVGGAAAAFGAAWAIEKFIDTLALLWFVAALIAAASGLVFLGYRRFRISSHHVSIKPSNELEAGRLGGLGAVFNSKYLRTLALLILLSVVVSTLIDFQFKAAAKQAYSSRSELTAFFSSYYGWLSITTFLLQTLATGRILGALGLFPSLYLTPAILLAGSLTILLSPSLIAAAITRIADAALRDSLQRSTREVLYFRLLSNTRKFARTFLDVVVERTGDALAGVVILLFTLWFSDRNAITVQIICVAVILLWILLIPVLQVSYRGLTRSEDRAQSRGTPRYDPPVTRRSQFRAK